LFVERPKKKYKYFGMVAIADLARFKLIKAAGGLARLLAH
jgi:hypothetical protein